MLEHNSQHINILCTASNKCCCLLTYILILLYVGEMGRKCILVGAKLSATYMQLIRYNELAILMAISASVAELHYKDL